MILLYDVPGAALFFVFFLAVLTIYVAAEYADGVIKTISCVVLLVAIAITAFYFL